MDKNSFQYSVAIRTVGKAGDKFIQELESLHTQTIKPSHIYVHLAHGFERPKEQVGMEEYIDTPKGLVHQRAAANMVEEDYVLMEVQGESHSLSESITVEELQQMGNVLSCKNAPIEEAAKAAETIYKIHDSPMFQAIKKAAGERVRELLERVAEEAPKEVQSGNFDYKRFIKT